MAKFLFAAYPEFGHVSLPLSVAVALRQRGHRVAFYTGRSFADTITGAGLTFCEPREWETPDANKRFQFPVDLWANPEGRSPRELWSTVGRTVRERILGKVEAMARDVKAYSRELDADLVVHEILTPGAGLAAESLGLPWATVGVYPVPVLDAYKQWIPREIWGWFANTEVRHNLGLVPRPENLMGHISPFLHLVPASPAFVGDDQLPPQVHCIGPLCWSAPQTEAPAWLEELADLPATVLVSTSTAYSSASQRWDKEWEDYVRSTIQGLQDEPVTVIMTLALARGQDPDLFAPWPANFRPTSFVPHDLLMPKVRVVMTHGGWGTTGRALTYGIPVVIVPFVAEEPGTAARCQELGLGVTIPLGEVSPERIRASVRAVLDDPTFRARAQAESETIRELDPLQTSAELLEALAN